MAKGSIRFDDLINVEVAVDPTQDAGAKLLSAVNLVDGQSLGGGGGSSDFSTATVTVVNNTENRLQLYDAPICVEENALGEGSPACVVSQFKIDSGVYKLPLYKGTCVWSEFYNLVEGATISLSGDLTKLSNNLVITGDGTITINAE